MMKLVSISALMVFAAASAASGQAQTKIDYEKLGADPMIALPASLGQVVGQSSAAVVAEVTTIEPLGVREATSAGGTSLGLRGVAPYRIRIKEVLFNRLGETAPPLVVGKTIRVTQAVGSEGARAFDAKQTHVMQGDECLLLLWHRGADEDWSLVPWQAQFRRAKEHSASAEVVLPKGSTRWLTASSLSVNGAEDAPYVNWDALVAEVRRIGPDKKLP